MAYGNNTELVDAIREILGLDALPLKDNLASKRSETDRFWFSYPTNPTGQIFRKKPQK